MPTGHSSGDHGAAASSSAADGGTVKSVTYFDRHIRPYFALWRGVEELEMWCTVRFIRIDVSALIAEVKKKAREWIDKYCSILLEDASKELMSVHQEMVEYEGTLYDDTENIDELQSVLSTIQSIQHDNMRMLLAFESIKERFRCLETFGYPLIPEENLTILGSMTGRWEHLMFESKKRDIELLRVKEKFTFVTRYGDMVWFNWLHFLK